MTRSQIGLKSGSKAIGASLWSGMKGVVTTPVNEVKKKGAIGLLTGTMKGVSGLVVKPAIGVLDFFSESTNGIKNSTQSAFGLRSAVNKNVAYEEGSDG